MVAGSPGSLAVMDHRAEAWYRRRTTHWQEWPLGAAARDEAARGLPDQRGHPGPERRTHGGERGRPLHRALVADAPLVDELIVIDSDSTDGNRGRGGRGRSGGAPGGCGGA